MKTKNIIYIISAILVLLLVAYAGYWYLFLKVSSNTPNTGSNSQSTGFIPFGRTPSSTGNTGTTAPNNTAATTSSATAPAPVPALRLLSDSPIGGYGVATTASTTLVHWIDRGRGNIFEADENISAISTLSNTLLPRMYQSIWNKDATAFVGSLLQEGNDAPTTVYASLLPRTTPKTGTSTSAASTQAAALTQFTLKGNSLPDNVIGFAESPKKDKVFVLIESGDSSIGYVGTFGAKAMTEIFTSPLTQVNIDWPTDTIITITTKGSADQNGYLYFVDVKTGVWTKMLGPVPGLSTKVSHDGKYILASSANNNSVTTTIYNLQKGTNIDAVIRTIADKCTWGNFYKNLVYCGVPSQLPSGTYPDDWYKGTISFSDKIWQVNADTGEVHLLSTVVDQSDRLVDTFNLGLDSKDNYLLFMSKNDLSFWSLDLVKQ